MLCHADPDPESTTPAEDTQYLCKWCELSYAECSWEYGADILPEAEAAVEKYRTIEEDAMYRREKMVRHQPAARIPANFEKRDSQPEGYGGPTLQLHDYQLEGMNWLRHAWYNTTNVILADEMGLGKTIQV